jgi:hypothetical protein
MVELRAGEGLDKNRDKKKSGFNIYEGPSNSNFVYPQKGTSSLMRKKAMEGQGARVKHLDFPDSILRMLLERLSSPNTQ